MSDLLRKLGLTRERVAILARISEREYFRIEAQRRLEAERMRVAAIAYGRWLMAHHPCRGAYRGKCWHLREKRQNHPKIIG